jgi:hypothetical protein
VVTDLKPKIRRRTRFEIVLALILSFVIIQSYILTLPAKGSISVSFELAANDSSSTSGYQYELSSDGSNITQSNANSLGIKLGPLASRSQAKEWVSFSGSAAPYTVVGIDSRSNQEYTFQTSVEYSRLSRKESDERGFSSFTFSRTLNHTYDSRSNVIYLRSNGACTNNGNSGGTYCSVFGPEVWTNPFDATAGQALSFDYAASASDNYEVYAFLVKVNETAPGSGLFDYGGGKFGETTNPLTTHNLILYERGKSTAWKTGSGTVPETGKYRFRFVDGAYDQTGGYALGTDFYIDPASITVAESQTITFEPLGDKLISDSSFVISNMPTSSSTLPVSVTSASISECTISGSTVTLIQNGNCVLSANQAGGTTGGVTYAAASTVTRTFQIRAAATKPSNTGALPSISGTRSIGSTLTALEGSWSDGGSPITGTTFQWQNSVDGSNWSNIDSATSDSYLISAEDVGKRLRVVVTKTNSIGSQSENSGATTPIPTPVLTDILFSSGTLSPSFSSVVTAYTMNLINSIENITLTPSVSSGTITVNGSNVTSGQASSPISLNVGDNTLTVVTNDGSVNTTYTIVITRMQSTTSGSSSGSITTVTPTPTPTQTPSTRRTITPTPTQTPLRLLPQLTPSPTPTPTQTSQAGVPTRPVDLVRRAIEEVVEVLRPRIVDLNTLISPTNNTDSVASASAAESVSSLASTTALSLVQGPEDEKRVSELPSSVLKDGVSQESRIIVVQETKSQVVTADGGLLTLEAKAGQDSVPVDTQGRVQMVRENSVEAEGQGLRADSEFAVYLFSDPIMLGIGRTDLAGRFFASFPVEKELPLGDHTLQVVGVTPTGEQRTVSMPVVVVEDRESATAQALPQAILVDQNPVEAWYQSINYLLTLLFLLILVALWILSGSRKRSQQRD